MTDLAGPTLGRRGRSFLAFVKLGGLMMGHRRGKVGLFVERSGLRLGRNPLGPARFL